MSVENTKNPAGATFSADGLLLAVVLALIGAFLWFYWGQAATPEPPLQMLPVAWDSERMLPGPIKSLSSLYQLSGKGERLTVRVEGVEAGTALLVWLEGEWVVMPLLATGEEYSAYFDGWLPDLVTVANLPTATRGQ